MAAVRSKQAFYTAHGARAEELDARALAGAEPQLRQGLAGALLVPDDGVIYAPCAARWLSRASSVELGVPVAEIVTGGVRLANGTGISAGLMICAAGAWATALVPGLNIRPRKGHLAITDRYPG